MNDTISDMLARIRNGLMAHKPEVVLPYSKFKQNLANVLVQEGWIKNMEVRQAGAFKNIALQLKYDEQGSPVISNIKRISKPGQRIYAGSLEIPKSLGGIGTTIISTSRGLMTDKQARKNKIGGEVVCQIW
jgi:small subunit ribosomal protein S8